MDAAVLENYTKASELVHGWLTTVVDTSLALDEAQTLGAAKQHVTTIKHLYMAVRRARHGRVDENFPHTEHLIAALAWARSQQRTDSTEKLDACFDKTDAVRDSLREMVGSDGDLNAFVVASSRLSQALEELRKSLLELHKILSATAHVNALAAGTTA